MQIDYDDGVETETMTVDEFNKRNIGNTTMPEITGVNTITVYSIKDVEVENYCPKHQGVVNVDGQILKWSEECSCE